MSVLTHNLLILLGFDAAGQPIVVEIDEVKFFHRKYHRGQFREGHWVFRGIEFAIGRCFMMVMANRTRATLENEIANYILHGSHIISDGWAAYAHIDQMQSGVYIHETVIHDANFVNPDIHTQNIENMWMHVKQKLRR